MKRSLFVAGMCALLFAFFSVGTSRAAIDRFGVTSPASSSCEARTASGTSDGVNRAGLVVTFGGGRTENFCIEFTEESITGMQLLQRSGLTVVTDSFGGVGAAVCNIDGEGCDDPGNCFCKCGGGQCQYWAYFQFRDGAWAYSPQGSGLRIVRDGDTDGWVWGPIGNGDGLPRGTPDCAITPTATPLPTGTPTAKPTRTPAPTRTPTTRPAATTSAPPTAPTMPQPPAPPTASSDVAGATAVAPHADVVPRAAAATPTPPRHAVTAADATLTAAATRTSTSTAPAGVVRVSAAEGEQNARTSSSRSVNSGSYMSLIGFAAVAVVVGGGAGFMLLRRNRGAR